MKITFFVHCFFPDHFYGTETYTLDLARHYQTWGHDVTVVSAIFQGEAKATDLVTRYDYQGIPVVCIDKNYLPHSQIKETYYQSDMSPVLENILNELQPDIVHVTHLINHTAALLEITAKLGIPTYATFTDFFGFCLNNKLEAANGELCAGPSTTRTNCVACYLKDAAHNPYSENWIKKASTPFAAKYIAVMATILHKLPINSGSKDKLVDDIVNRPTLLNTLYNNGYHAAVAPTQFLNSAYRANGMKMPLHNIWFGVDIDRSPKTERPSDHIPVIGFIGQIAPHKGTDLLVEAFCRLPRDKARLHIYGPEDQDAVHMANLRTLATDHDVQFRGTFPKESMANVLQAIDLLVIPSRWYENSPLVLLNALATHTPVLVSNVSGMTEFVQDGINGRVFERGSVEDLFKQLEDIVAYPEKNLYSLTKTTSFEREIADMARETLKIYSDLAE
jgi:glycosyltransferase involved in cell wall biosynthesis